MIRIILHAFVENSRTGVVEIVFASTDENAVKQKATELKAQFPNDYLAVYDLPLDTDLNKLPHYPSVTIGREEFE
ncbi:phosphoribosylaminoimidazole carboxylase [Streptococcus sp. H49]|uniref:phosphoribosylaminoimidazole carboxylase n=1 Tax=Streptococcus huangxiaojuni TaxID=3237239 RepID=UPI0034A5BE11